MSAGRFVSILSIVLAMSIGQLLFKAAARSAPATWRLDVATLWSLATNGYLVAALFLYAATTILWVYVLREAPLSTSYPFMALAMVIVPTAGVLLFAEPVSPSLVLGIGLVIAGILVVAAGF
ncbi:EamA family transporter [Tianweitania sp.]|uniref:EamA family transporter n=1 Tax=Tianweitania sp. TaxID=2021634 RepID=UPI00289BA0EA|nr:EamA family transporter [Tianweitania sp.]